MYKIKIPGNGREVIVDGIGKVKTGDWVTVSSAQALRFEQLQGIPLEDVNNFEVRKTSKKKEDD